MKKSHKRPDSPEVVARILKRIEQMTPEEVIAFLEYRTPGVEETDMTGMFGLNAKNGHETADKPSETKP